MIRKLLILTICSIGLLGCTTAQPTNTPETETIAMSDTTPEPLPELADTEEIRSTQTNIRPDGNRVVDGKIDFPNVTSLDIALSGQPEWVVGIEAGDGIVWTAVLEDGRIEAFQVVDGVTTAIALNLNSVPAGMPPLLAVRNGSVEIVVPNGEFSAPAHPVIINKDGDLAYITPNGDLVVEHGEESTTLEINSQLDGRILVDENGRLLVNTDPTNQYAHGIMGDDIEAGSLTLIATQPEIKVIRTIPIQEGWVMESIAPIWTDFNGDGTREIITTRANSQEGAQVVVMSEEGDLLATGPSIGQGNRWRHQIAVAPFGPSGENELVEVRTPHIGGPTGFFRWQGDQLERTTAANGYTTHVIFSRNLDMGIVGRFDTSGRLTVLMPNQVRTELGGVQHTDQGAEIVWTMPLSGKLATNIAATPYGDGCVAIAIGLDSNTLRIWQK